MAATKIPWCDKVWNPVTGCDAISVGCAHCYARRMATRLAGRFGYPKTRPFRVTLHEDKLVDPIGWRKPARVFPCSMGDLFHEKVSDYYIQKVTGVMVLCPRHTFMILTKRIDRAVRFFDNPGWFKENPHVWIGVTICNQAEADAKIPELERIPAKVRFVSVEPMLSRIDPSRLIRFEGTLRPAVHWIIVGGETGPGARYMKPEWAREIRDNCELAGVPFFFKQLGAKRKTPPDLRVRELPK